MKNIKEIIKTIFVFIYLLISFMILPWFWGAIDRNEQSLYFWKQYEIEFARHGLFNAIFTVVLYLIFYSIPFSIVNYVIYKYHGKIKLSDRILISIWASFTFLLFLYPFNFIIDYLFNKADFRIFVVWLIFSFVIINNNWSYLKERYKKNNKISE